MPLLALSQPLPHISLPGPPILDTPGSSPNLALAHSQLEEGVTDAGHGKGTRSGGEDCVVLAARQLGPTVGRGAALCSHQGRQHLKSPDI